MIAFQGWFQFGVWGWVTLFLAFGGTVLGAIFVCWLLMKGSRKTTDLLSARRWRKIAGAHADGPEEACSNHSEIGAVAPDHGRR